MENKIKSHILKYLEENIRFDGRKPTEFREISIKTGVTKTAEGSASVSIGETEIIAGVKFEVGLPYPDKQDEGTIMVNAEMLPLSSPEFESGPPGLKSIELARVVDRGIRESMAIDMKKLCIKEGEQVWTIIIDICTINDAGNLLDASGIGALAALLDAKFPKLDQKKIDFKEKTSRKVEMKILPIPVTVYKIGDKMILDPIKEEEEASDARLTVTSLEDGTLCALQKGGDMPLSVDDVGKMIDIAVDKAQEIRKLITGGKHGKR
jgi:exosome complex component RRP42